MVVFGALIYFGYENFVKPKAPLATPMQTGLNSKLPDATAAKEMSKLEIYLQAEKDSAERSQQRENDPNTKHLSLDLSAKTHDNFIGKPSLHSRTKPGLQLSTAKPSPTREEDEIDRKMRELNKLMQSPDVPRPKTKTGLQKIDQPVEVINGMLAAPLATAHSQELNVDPELLKLDGMLDKLRDLQNPSKTEEKSSTLPRNVDTRSNVVTLNTAIPNQTIQAVVHNTQTLTNGATVKLRLLNDVLIGEKPITKGSFVYGIGTISNERLQVQVSNINVSNSVVPVSVTVFDIDGIEGIYIPGALEREVSKEGAEQAIQSLNLNSYNPTLSGQLATAGIQATKSLLSRKVKLQRVTLKAGHHVLLQNTKNN